MSVAYVLGGILAGTIAIYGILRVVRERNGRRYLAAELDTQRSGAATRIQALNEHLHNKALALEAANRELESFSYSVAHDLRTPLRAIGSYAAMLNEDFSMQLPPEANRYIGVIRDSAERMERLIADLLAFSGLGRAPLRREMHDPKPLILRACNEVLDDHPGTVPQIEVLELPPASGDCALLRHVWVNLIDNAVKYSSKSVAPRIEIAGSVEGQEAIFSIRDNGAGFDMRYADKLFGVFQRLHGEDEFPGTGVGLAIVHRVVSRHGGRIWAQSEPGRGAVFFFSLPRETQ